MQRRIEFDSNSLLKLIVHYYQDHTDRVPLDAELIAAGVSPIFQRMVVLQAKSDKWDGIRFPPGWNRPYPLMVRYEGGKTMSWGNDGQAPTDQWKESVGSPNA